MINIQILENNDIIEEGYWFRVLNLIEGYYSDIVDFDSEVRKYDYPELKSHIILANKLEYETAFKLKYDIRPIITKYSTRDKSDYYYDEKYI